jgi:hypothetical protein
MTGAVRMAVGALPRAPTEIADAVELYARESNRHATLHFIPIAGRLGCWVVRMTLKPDDPRLSLYRDGKVAEPPTEHVWLHEPLGLDEPRMIPTYAYRPLNIHELGAAGVRAWLDRSNLWSGRGELSSLEQQVQDTVEAGRQAAQKRRTDAEDQTRALVRDRRRWYQRIPFLPVLWGASHSKEASR